jgi:hypothetical protein
MKGCFNLIFIIGFIIVGYAQKAKQQDTARIVSFSDKFILKLNLDTQLDAYKIRNITDNSVLKIASNNDFRLSLSLDYEFIGASIGFSPEFFSDNIDDELKGNSSYSDYQFRFFMGNWVQGLHYSRIKGYYVENTADYFPIWEAGTDPYIQFPDLKSSTWGMSTAYICNPNFSFRNVIYQTEWQKKSAGSLVPTLFYDYNRLSFRIDSASSIEDYFNIRLAMPYYYTWVLHENWFVAPFLAPSIGVRFSKYRDNTSVGFSKSNEIYRTQQLDGGIQLGYSSRKVIFGANINFDVNGYKENSKTTITNDKVYGLLYVGYRLNPPKAVSKYFN